MAQGQISVKYWTSPVGQLIIGAYGGSLCLCDWVYDKRRSVTDERMHRLLMADYCATDDDPVIDEAIGQLNEYFDGLRRSFDMPLLHVGTPFQRSVWMELVKIVYGQRISYTDLADNVGGNRAVRAVAAACAANPISIFVPCHRVVGRNGALTGYAGGLNAKSYLLNLEAGKDLFSNCF